MVSKGNRLSSGGFLKVSVGLLIWIIPSYDQPLEKLTWKSKPEMWLLVTLVCCMPHMPITVDNVER